MPIGPDSRYYVHASTRAAHAQQEYLVEEANLRAPSTARAKAQLFDLRTDSWVVVAVIALLGTIALLVSFTR